jgi:hypothetical protein
MLQFLQDWVILYDIYSFLNIIYVFIVIMRRVSSLLSVCVKNRVVVVLYFSEVLASQQVLKVARWTISIK